MTSIYADVADRAATTIAAKGGTIVFLADTFRGGSIASDVTGSAVEIPGDPDTYSTLGVTVANPVTLIVSAVALNTANLNPVPVGAEFTWGGTRYSVKLATPTGPDATPIIWTIVGVAG